MPWMMKKMRILVMGDSIVSALPCLTTIMPRSLPRISYMKALDIYLAFCFFMVFGALLEYAAIGYTHKRIQLTNKALRGLQAKVGKC